MNDIYVVGTDTGVGKTVLSLLLMQFFFERGRQPFYFKPLQTGCLDAHDKDSDAVFIYRNVGALKDKDPSESVGYCFREPKAPYFAARNEGRDIDLQYMNGMIEEKSRLYDPVILEAAGGLMVPVTEEVMMIDTVFSGAKVLLAARAGLGTINHTMLSIEALRQRGISPAGVVFLDPAGTVPEMIAENMEAVERYTGIKVAGVIGKIEDFSRPPQECFHPLEFLFPSGVLCNTEPDPLSPTR